MERLQNHSKLLLSILGHRRKKEKPWKTSVLIRLQILTLIRHLSLLWFFPLRWVVPHPATGRVPEFGAHPSRVSTCAIKCLGNRQKLAATGIFTGECLKGAYIIKWYTAFLYSLDFLPHHHVLYCFFNSKIHGDLVRKKHWRCPLGHRIHQFQILHHHGRDGGHTTAPHHPAANLFARPAAQHGLQGPGTSTWLQVGSYPLVN